VVIKNKYDYGLFFVLGISLLLSLCYCPPFDRLTDDREIFRYAGMAILRGQVPYRDFFDHKPPLIFFFNAAGLFIGGAWGLWILSALLSLLTTGIFFRRCVQQRLSLPWLLPLLFNLMIRDNLISWGANMTREYTTCFFVLLFCAFAGRSRFRGILVGFYAGLIFFTQQEQVLAVLPFLVYIAWTERACPLYLRIGRLALGFGLVFVPILCYFAWNHSLGYFWEDGFRFNTVWYISQPKSMGDHFGTIKRSLDDGNYELPVMIAIVLGWVSLFRPHRQKAMLVAALAALFLSFAPELMGSRFQGGASAIDLPYYFLPLAGTVSVLLFVVFAFSAETGLASPKAQVPFALLLCTSLTYTALQHSTHLERRSEDPDLHFPAMNYLRQHRPADHDLYVFNYDDYIYAYNEFGVLSPSRWIYHHMWGWYAGWDADQSVLASIAADLDKYHTTYILMDPALLDQFVNSANAAYWRSFMQRTYEPMSIPGENRVILWKRKQGI
jgi:hypothetical protein